MRRPEGASASQEGDAGRQSPRRGFNQIVAGTMFGQVVTFFALPFLSRLYSSEQFGLLTLSLSVAAIVAPVALLGFDHAVLQPRLDRAVAPLAVSGLVSLLLVCVAFAAVIAWGPVSLSEDDRVRPFLVWALPALLLVTGTAMMFAQLAVRSGQYARIGSRITVQSVAITVSQLGMAGTAHLGSFNGLVAGAVVGTSCGGALLATFGRRYSRRVSLQECLRSIRFYWRFPVAYAPVNTLALLAQQTPALFTIAWFGVAAGGHVGMAERVAAVPLALVGVAAASVFAGEFSRAVRAGSRDLAKRYLATSRWLVLLAAAVFVGLAALAPTLLPLFLGTSWQTAASIAQAMAVVAATRMMASPLRAVFRLLGRARVAVGIDVARIVLLAGAATAVAVSGLELLPSLTLLFAALAIADVLAWFMGWRIAVQADHARGPSAPEATS